MQFITTGNRIAVENFEIGYFYTITMLSGNYFQACCTGIGSDFVMFSRDEPDLLFSLTMQSAADVSSIELYGGGSGTNDYNDLSNKPQINSITLTGNKSLSDLGIQETISDLDTIRSGAAAGATAVQPAAMATALAAKQDTLSSAQLAAVNSGIDSTKVAQIEINKNNISTAFANKKVKIVAGVIRNSGSGWHLINDDNHKPINLDSVSVDNANNIVVSYGFTAKKVLSLVVTPDDTFAKLYTCGASVGLSAATISVYTIPHTIGGFVYYNNNAWDIQYSDFTNVAFNSSSGQLTLTHESLANLATREALNISVSGRDCNARLFGQGSDTIQIKFYDWDGNIITSPNSEKVFVCRTINSVHVNANNLVSSGGNFWIYGILEVD